MSLLKSASANSMVAPFRDQNLLIDADDTLWENNVYFEQAIAAFIEHLNHQHYSPAEVRSFLNEVERQSVLEHGYGLHSFRRSLLRCFETLSHDPLTPEREQEIVRFTGVVEDHVIRLLPGVSETLPRLAEDHRLFLMTKGNFLEQTSKLKRSGLEQYFAGVEITVEKSAEAYRAVIEKFKLSEESTWMIGNSPKSDINPALEAGLNAVFVPHANTWVLERDQIQTTPVGQVCLQVERFADLRGLFCSRNHAVPMV
ncbi:MAG TPA: HAD family hydrolase [Acidobacteriaceae bacterium]|nr:HAD family hydrolase [Acidobacteriaceae bacterium]